MQPYTIISEWDPVVFANNNASKNYYQAFPGGMKALMWNCELTIGRRYDIDEMIYPDSGVGLACLPNWARRQRVKNQQKGLWTSVSPVPTPASFILTLTRLRLFPYIHRLSQHLPTSLGEEQPFSTLLLRCDENWECFEFNGALK